MNVEAAPEDMLVQPQQSQQSTTDSRPRSQSSIAAAAAFERATAAKIDELHTQIQNEMERERKVRFDVESRLTNEVQEMKKLVRRIRIGERSTTPHPPLLKVQPRHKLPTVLPCTALESKLQTLLTQV